ncbi:hypothetical protein LTR27_011411 [Elasticomyces elasticus]|nr:hypothetical protein LTR27_011411 [Elasticomyces elasticus]
MASSTNRFLIIIFVALGSLTYGYCASIIATTLGQPTFISYFALDTRSNAASLTGAINGLFQAGGLIGTLCSSFLADSLGRRKAILIAAIVTVIGGALQAGSVAIAMYIVMRLVTGWGIVRIGALVTLVPVYMSEISPPEVRGLLVGMHGVLICSGYALASWVGLGFYFVQAGGAQWRIPLAIQCLPPLLLTAGIMFLPESPRWLLTKDKIDEAFLAFSRTRDSNDNRLQSEFALLTEQVRLETYETPSWMDFARQPGLRKRCIIGWLTMFGAQGTATLVINNYGPSLYSSLGFGTVQQLLIQCGWITVCPFGNWINALVVDRLGRTRLLMFGFAGCVLALIGECITVSIYQRTGQRTAASAAVFFLFMHIAAFSSSVDATSYIYASEIFPTPARAKGMSISVSGLFVATIIFLQAAPTAFAAIGWQYYLVFICITSVLFVVVWTWFPETTKQSLEDVAVLFNDIPKADFDHKDTVNVNEHDFPKQ